MEELSLDLNDRRVDGDGEAYTFEEYVDFYGFKSALSRWQTNSAEQPLDTIGGNPESRAEQPGDINSAAQPVHITARSLSSVVKPHRMAPPALAPFPAPLAAQLRLRLRAERAAPGAAAAAAAVEASPSRTANASPKAPPPVCSWPVNPGPANTQAYPAKPTKAPPPEAQHQSNRCPQPQGNQPHQRLPPDLPEGQGIYKCKAPPPELPFLTAEPPAYLKIPYIPDQSIQYPQKVNHHRLWAQSGWRLGDPAAVSPCKDNVVPR